MNRTDQGLADALHAWTTSLRSNQRVVKAVVGDPKTIRTEERSVTAVITRQTLDRDGEVIVTRGLNLDNYARNPVVLFMHDQTWIVGRSGWRKVQTGADGIAELLSLTIFAENEKGREAWGLTQGGFLNAWSVGLLPNTMQARRPTAGEKAVHGPKLHTVVTIAEMIEYSAVSIPAHADALTTAKNKGLIKLSEPLFEPFLRAVTDANPRKKPYLRVVQKPADAQPDRTDYAAYHKWAFDVKHKLWRGFAVPGVSAAELKMAVAYCKAFKEGRI